jgi:SAM-dependent methyltransferase
MNIYDSKEKINASFSPDFIPEEQLQTQWSELLEIKKAIHNLYKKKKKKLAILDIGVGTGRIIKHLSSIPEIWDCIEYYAGIDNNDNCIALARENMAAWQLEQKVSILKLAAKDIDKLQKKYDLIMTTWFTPGNFYPEDFDFAAYNPEKKRLALKTNPAFTQVWAKAYKMLKKRGIVILGSCYYNNNPTRLKQENFYEQLGMTLITNPEESFTATKEGFWSQRFTLSILRRYLKNTGFRSICEIPLDTYQFAFQAHLLK